MGLTESKPISDDIENTTPLNSDDDKESSWDVVDSEETSETMPELETIEKIATEIVEEVTEKAVSELLEEQNKDEELKKVVEKFVDELLKDCVEKSRIIENERALQKINETEEFSDNDEQNYTESLNTYLDFIDEMQFKKNITIEARKLDTINEDFESVSDDESSDYDYTEQLALESEEQDTAFNELLETFENTKENVKYYVNKYIKVDELKSFLKLSLFVYIGSSLCSTAM